MNKYLLTNTFDDFSKKINEQRIKGLELGEATILSIEDLANARKRKHEWISETIDALNKCFSIPNNHFVANFRNSGSGIMPIRISGQTPDFKSEIQNFRNSISFHIKGLDEILEESKLSDVMINPDEVDFQERKEWTIDQKQMFVLEKLCKVKSGIYTDIKPLMEFNGIDFKNDIEVIELLEDMENMGLIEPFKGLGAIAAKITIQGRKLIEQNSKRILDNSDVPTAQEYEAMSEKINDIIARLKRAGVEREILFEELQELKELYKTLKKKNWKHIVLGKMGDLALSKLIERETLNDIYHQLTGMAHDLRIT